MKSVDRFQNETTLPNKKITSSMVVSQLDILAGHLPLGAGDHAWRRDDNNNNGVVVVDQTSTSNPTHHNNNNTIIHYVTFFRHPVTKFVSGIMYQKKDQNYSYDDIIELIRHRVRGERAQGKYREGYSAYLLTPQQKEVYYGNNFSVNSSTVEDRTQQILRNLSDLRKYHLLVGIVERMSESLELLQFVIDGDYEQTYLFESYGMKKRQQGDLKGDNNGEANTTVPAKVNNPSKFSTESVVDELRKDADFYAVLEEYVKYDHQIYAHALNLHKMQYRQLLRQQRGHAIPTFM